MDLQLRPYQQRLIDVASKHLKSFPASRPVIVAPTASGKSVIVAALCAKLVKECSGMILVLTHRRELVAQNAAKLPAHMNVGVYSAGLGRKELHRITVAGFQSIRKQASKLPEVSYIIIDECHYATAGYREFIDTVAERSPKVRVVGLTATPFDGTANRTALHLLPANKAIFTGIGAEVSMGELLRDGYLTQLTPYSPANKLDTTNVAIDNRLGDFAIGQLQAAVDVDESNVRVANEIMNIFAERQAVMVFCTGVEHTRHMVEALRALGEEAELVLGDTPDGERDKIINRFKQGKLKYLVACEVLLVGFDAPICDGIANLRPTKSGLIWVQLCGRGMRLHPGKRDCLVADFTDTSMEIGPLDEVEGQAPKLKLGEAPTKMCDECFSICLAGLKFCPTCGTEFLFADHQRADNFDPETGLLVSGVVKNEDGTRTYPVERVQYEIKRTVAGDPALVASYMSPGRANPVAHEYLNLWHHKASVVARDAATWLRRQKHSGGSVPVSAQEALARAEMGALKTPRTVSVRPGSPWPVRFSV
jgi:DNA repair protein RadD